MSTPIPPEGAPKYIKEGLKKQDIDVLTQLSDYCERLAAAKETELETEMEGEQVDEGEVPDDWEGDRQEWEEAIATAEAPPKATVTTKEISGNKYLYWQWREGSEIRSEYIAPVNPSNG
jgi:hypothetical protein